MLHMSKPTLHPKGISLLDNMSNLDLLRESYRLCKYKQSSYRCCLASCVLKLQAIHDECHFYNQRKIHLTLPSSQFHQVLLVRQEV